MVSNVWRQRESSCLALSNLLQGLFGNYLVFQPLISFLQAENGNKLQSTWLICGLGASGTRICKEFLRNIILCILSERWMTSKNRLEKQGKLQVNRSPTSRYVNEDNISLKLTQKYFQLRLCDPSYTNPAAGQQAITIVLNFLLKEGLLTQAKEVRLVLPPLHSRLYTDHWTTRIGALQ